jgi:dTDP-4-amino-4,6-dideoxygalactose transaminase
LLINIDRLTVNRDFIISALTKENIGVGLHYEAVHTHPYYKRFGYKLGDFKNAEFISKRTLSLPISAKLTDSQVEDVIKAVTKVLLYYRKTA